MGARTEHTPGTFSYVDLSTTDPEAAKAFYGELRANRSPFPAVIHHDQHADVPFSPQASDRGRRCGGVRGLAQADHISRGARAVRADQRVLRRAERA